MEEAEDPTIFSRSYSGKEMGVHCASDGSEPKLCDQPPQESDGWKYEWSTREVYDCRMWTLFEVGFGEHAFVF